MAEAGRRSACELWVRILLVAGLRPSCEKGSPLAGVRAVGQDEVIKGLGMSSRVCVTGHMKDPLALAEKDRASCPGGMSIMRLSLSGGIMPCRHLQGDNSAVMMIT